MNRDDGILRHVLAAGLIAVAFYVVGFYWIQHRRAEHGPWKVAFAADSNGYPFLVIGQNTLNIEETLSFPGQKIGRSNYVESIVFAKPVAEAPFGKIIFQDLTFLPGTVTLGLFGHEVEMLPRVLTIDKKEHPWRRGERIIVP